MDGREISAKSSGEGVPRGSTCGLTLLFLVSGPCTSPSQIPPLRKG